MSLIPRVYKPEVPLASPMLTLVLLFRSEVYYAYTERDKWDLMRRYDQIPFEEKVHARFIAAWTGRRHSDIFDIPVDILYERLKPQ